MMTLPTDRGYDNNTVVGYSARGAHGLDHLENVSTFKQIAFFSGAYVYPDMYFVRPVYGWLASNVVPFVGLRNSARVMNVLLWFLAVLVVRRTVHDLGGDRRAQVLAAALSATGAGWLLHVSDYSAHTLSFAVYYIGIAELVRLALHPSPLSLRDRFAHGCALGLSGLAYNTSLYLMIIYIVITARQGRLWSLLIPVALGLLIPLGWEAVLLYGMYQAADPAAQSAGFGEFSKANALRMIEQRYLERSLAMWRETASLGGGAVGVSVFRKMTQFLAFESPIVVVSAGIAVIVWIRRVRLPRAVWVVLILGCLLPLAGGVVWSPAADARGYLLYCASIIVYAVIAVALTTIAGQRLALGRRVAVVAIAVLFGAHVFWNASYTWGALAPLKSYFLGYRLAAETFIVRTQFFSITRAEPTPRLLGGDADIVAAGYASPAPSILIADSSRPLIGPHRVDLSEPEEHSLEIAQRASLSERWIMSVLAKSYISVVLLAFVLSGCQARRGWWAVAVLIAIVGSSGAVALIPSSARVPSFTATAYGIRVSAGEQIVYAVTPAADVLGRLSAFARPGDTLKLRSPNATRMMMTVTSVPGSSPVPARVGLVLPFDALAESRLSTIEVQFTPEGPTPAYLACWQRPDLPGRRVVVDHNAAVSSAGCVPALELQVASPTGHVSAVAYE